MWLLLHTPWGARVAVVFGVVTVAVLSTVSEVSVFAFPVLLLCPVPFCFCCVIYLSVHNCAKRIIVLCTEVWMCVCMCVCVFVCVCVCVSVWLSLVVSVDDSHFKRLGVVGRGAFGVVYLARRRG